MKRCDRVSDDNLPGKNWRAQSDQRNWRGRTPTEKNVSSYVDISLGLVYAEWSFTIAKARTEKTTSVRIKMFGKLESVWASNFRHPTVYIACVCFLIYKQKVVGTLYNSPSRGIL
jgi:hypothetical protein